jgi:uncharacterized protein (DUF1778 family)
MRATARLDLKIEAEEKEVISRAATLMGTTMAAFVRVAAKEKARDLLERESRVTMTERDFQTFTSALQRAFRPNPALKRAMSVARKVKRA